jgi:hypothetical protein
LQRQTEGTATRRAGRTGRQEKTNNIINNKLNLQNKMKKFAFMFVAMSAMMIASCGGNKEQAPVETEEIETVDTTAIDSLVDSTAVDSTAVDSAATAQ